MDIKQLKYHYDGMSKAAEAIGVSRMSLYVWQKRGIPEDQQLRIQQLTNGALKADEPILAKLRELVGQAS